jgi:molecular chaperone HscA
MLAEQRVDASRVLESLQGALASDAALLSEEENLAINAAVLSLQQTVQGNDPAAIEAAIKIVDATTQDFAARRMDASIRRALAGHSVDEV